MKKNKYIYNLLTNRAERERERKKERERANKIFYLSGRAITPKQVSRECLTSS